MAELRHAPQHSVRTVTQLDTVTVKTIQGPLPVKGKCPAIQVSRFYWSFWYGMSGHD